MIIETKYTGIKGIPLTLKLLKSARYPGKLTN